MVNILPSEAELGQISRTWSNSYNGQKCSFVNNHVFAYLCGATIKFFNVETKTSETFVPPHLKDDQGINSICLLATNTSLNKFAFSETQLAPTVYIYDYGQQIREQSKLIDGAVLEYLAIEFSNGEAILTLSGIPDLEIIIWSWHNGNRLTNISLNQLQAAPDFVCFSPTNWRHVAVAYKKEIHIWNLEQFNSKKSKTSKRKVLMPLLESSFEKQVVGAEFSDYIKYPTNIIAEASEEYAEKIEEMLTKSERHQFKALCWSNDDEIFIASDKSHLFKYSLADSSIKCVLKANQNESSESVNFFELSNRFKINELKLHKHGLLLNCDDGYVRVLGINSNENHQEPIIDQDVWQIRKVLETSSDFISNLSFNLKHTHLIISSNRGAFLVDAQKLFSIRPQDRELLSLKLNKANEITNDKEKRMELVLNYDLGRTVAIGCLNPYSENFCILKENGTVQIWNIKKATLVNKFLLGYDCSSMAIHSNMALVAIGTTDGTLIFIDMTNINAPRIINHAKMHKSSVKKLKFNTSGTLLFSVGCDNKLFAIDVRLSKRVEKAILKPDQRLISDFNKKLDKFEPGFHVLGYIEFEGELVCLDTFDYINEQSKINTRIVLGIHDPSTWELIDNKTSSNNQIQIFQVEPAIDRLKYFKSSQRFNYSLNAAVQTVKLASKVLTFELNLEMFEDASRMYQTIRLDFKEDMIGKTVFHSQYLFSDCVLTARSYLLIFAEKFLIKYTIPDTEPTKKSINKLNMLEFNEVVGVHDFGYGCLAKSTNNQFILSGGYDGTLSVRKASDMKTFIQTKGPHYTNGGIQQACFHNNTSELIVLGHDSTVNSFSWLCKIEPTIRLINQASVEGEFDRSQLDKLMKSEQIGELTWFEMKEKDFFKQQDEQYLPIRKQISTSLSEIQKKLAELMKQNENREELAKLKEHEFYLDLDELDFLHKEADGKIASIRESTEFDNLAKLFTRDVIKRECWDEMKVKGRGIQAFNSNFLVENYALKDRKKDELDLLERVKMVRRIELSAQKTRNQLIGEQMRRDNVGQLIETEDNESKETNDFTQPASQAIANTYLAPNLTQLSFKGSIGSLFNGDSNLFYNQFELYTKEQKWMQIILIQDAIYRIKDNFNKEFEIVMQRKNQEIAKIKEKNQRLKQIYVDLSEEKQLSEPQFGDSENPETLFEVKDSEIKVEKYLTPEQKRQLEEQEAEEARRRELERLDNWRERGLMDMMGGVLQIRREDELKKDIPVPPFVKEKPQEEWTPEEVKFYQLYEQKVKELNEEREKLKKQLNTEILKINEQILECYQNFDTQLFALHMRKVKTQQAIFQEELKINRLFNSLIVDSELDTYESQVNHRLEKLHEEKKQMHQDILQIKKALDIFKEEYEILLAEDKSQEKTFLREFADVSAATRELLLKLFRKRAKQRAPINKTNLNPNPVFMPELGADNPFSDRPSTAQQISIYDQDTETTLADLDNYEHAPAGLDESIWERFVYFRRQKIQMENSLRLKGLDLNEMSLYLQKRVEEDEQKKAEIEEFTKKSTEIQQSKFKVAQNLQVQLILKQGQVEIDPGAYVHNFENCLLINRIVVESLNKVIKSHGKQKISIMVDCKDHRKGIRQLEWDHRKMRMIIEDFIQKQKDITYLKLTREVQEFLNAEDYDGKKQKEIAVLEQTIAYQAKQHEKVVQQKAKKLAEVRNKSLKTANDNDKFDEKLKESNVRLYERKHISEELTGKTIETIREERFQQIVQRRKLVDLAKVQAQEVAFLRSEVERLRMKTFPALVQIEF